MGDRERHIRYALKVLRYACLGEEGLELRPCLAEHEHEIVRVCLLEELADYLIFKNINN